MAIAVVSWRAASFSPAEFRQQPVGKRTGSCFDAPEHPLNEALLPDLVALITGEYHKPLSVV